MEFPGIHTDEGHYVRRGLHVSEGLGVREPSSRYDHPYFGWLFLGNIFNIVGYPDSLSPKVGDTASIGAVWSVPRTLMGLLAVIDTFLIYKIAETRYNRKVAFIAAVLFAVMPYSWLTRRVVLESIQLPFILLSIFFVISYITNTLKKRDLISNTRLNQNCNQDNQNYVLNTANYDNNNSRNILLIFISGIFLGLAILTKLPAFTFMPVVGFLVYVAGRTKQEYDNGIRKNDNSNSIIITKKHGKKNGLKNLSLWFIPVILIPLLWPAYAISVGQYEAWIEGINFQITRQSKPLLNNIKEFYSIDPVLLILGIVGVGYCGVIKRELLFLIWIVPFLIFLYYIDYVSSFFLIPIIPPLCIAPAVMITDLSNRIAKNRKRIRQLLPFGIVSVIAIFGLINTTSLILKSENSNYLGVAAAITKQLPTAIGTKDGSTVSQDDRVTVIGNPRFYWILQYVFDKPHYTYKTQYNMINIHALERFSEGSEKVMMIADQGIMEIVRNEKQPDNAKAQLRAERLSEIYLITELQDKIGRVEIRTNY